MRSLFRLQRYFSNLKYSKSHEWVQFDSTKKTAKIGITNYAQSQLGQIIHVQLPSIGRQLNYLQSGSVIESVKIAADVNSLASGKVISINKQVQKNPNLVNDMAQTTWLFQIQYTKEPQDLLSQEPLIIYPFIQKVEEITFIDFKRIQLFPTKIQLINLFKLKKQHFSVSSIIGINGKAQEQLLILRNVVF